MALEEVGVRLVAAGEAAFLNAMKRADNSVDNFGKAALSADKPTQSLSARAVALAQIMSQAVYNAAMAAARAIANFATSSITAASDLAETTNKVNVVFGEQAAAVLEFGESAATSMGMSTNAALQAAGTYGNLFTSMGMTTDAAADMSMGIVKTAADLASFNNMTPEEVLEKLRAGLTGETEPLKSLGININQDVLAMKAMELGLSKDGKELTAAQKATATYALIMEQTTNATNDFAETSGGLANQQRIFKAQIENTKATLGAAFLPIVNKVFNALTGFLSSPAFQKGMQGFLDGLSEGISWIEANWPAVSETFTTVWNIISGVIDSISAIVTEFIAYFTTAWAENGDYIISNATTVWGVVTGIFNTVFNLIKGVFETVAPLVKMYLDLITSWWRENGESVISIVMGAWNAISAVISVVAELIMTIVRIMVGIISSIITNHGDQIMNAMKTAWSVISKIIQVISAIIITIVKALTYALKGDWQGLSDFLGNVWNQIWATIKSTAETAWANLSAWFKGIIKDIGNFFTETDWGAVGQAIIDGIWNGLSAGWTWLTDQIGNLAEGLFNAAKKALGIESPSKLFESIGINMMVGMEKGVLESAGRPAAATAMATQVLAPAAMAMSAPINNYYNNQTSYNLHLATSQTANTVQRSFAMMEMLG